MCAFLCKTEKIVRNRHDTSIESTKITILGNCMRFLLQSKTAFVLRYYIGHSCTFKKNFRQEVLLVWNAFAVRNHISITQLPPFATSRQNWQNFKTVAISLHMNPILSKLFARLPVLEVERQPIYTVSNRTRKSYSRPWLNDQVTFTSTWNTKIILILWSGDGLLTRWGFLYNYGCGLKFNFNFLKPLYTGDFLLQFYTRFLLLSDEKEWIRHKYSTVI